MSVNEVNITVINTSFYSVWVEGWKINAKVNNCILENSTGIIIVESPYQNKITEVLIRNDSFIGIKNCASLLLLNASFNNCKEALKIDNCRVIQNNLKFNDNLLDINLSGENAVKSFTGLVNISNIIGYYINIHLFDQNGTSFLNSDVIKSFSIDIYNEVETIHSRYSIDKDYTNWHKYAGSIRIPVLKQNKEGVISYFKPNIYTIELKIRLVGHMKEVILTKEINSKKMTGDVTLDFYLE